MFGTNRALGRTGKVLALAGATAAIAGAGVALGAVRAANRVAFLPPPNATTAAAVQGRGAPAGDSTRVRRLLESARGVNPLLCDLAARTVDGRSGWWSGSEGVLATSGSGDSIAGDVVTWVQHREVDASAVPMLRDALSDADACVRRLAAPLLGRIRDRSASQAMLTALAATDATVREMGALALGFADDSAAVAPLERRLRTDTSPRVRATAAWALGEIERPESARVLVEALQDADALVRRSAAHALGEIENPVAIPALTDLLKSDRDADVRRAAAHALGEIIG
jgi:hypothetical protein